MDDLVRGWTDGQDGYMDGWICGLTDRRTGRWVDGWEGGRKNARKYVWTDR